MVKNHNNNNQITNKVKQTIIKWKLYITNKIQKWKREIHLWIWWRYLDNIMERISNWKNYSQKFDSCSLHNWNDQTKNRTNGRRIIIRISWFTTSIHNQIEWKRRNNKNELFIHSKISSIQFKSIHSHTSND